MENKQQKGKLIELFLSDEVKINDCIKVKQKNKTNKTIKKIVKGWKPSIDSKYSEGVEVEMLADIENNKYKHKVVDIKTGELIHKEEMKLSEHK